MEEAHVVGRASGPCCGTCSGPMLWDVFGAHVVGLGRGGDRSGLKGSPAQCYLTAVPNVI